MDWNDVAHFVALVEHQTLTAAADALNVQHSTVSRRVAQLEAEFGLRLFDRIGKRYLLTEDGMRIYEHAASLDKDMKALRRLAKEQLEAQCEVVLTAPPIVMRDLIIPRLPVFFSRHPRIRLVAQGSPDLRNLHRRQADIALRLVRPQANDLVVRRLRQMQFAFHASPDYLDAHDRNAWQFLTLSTDSSLSRWAAGVIGNAPVMLAFNDFAFIRQGVQAGLGIGLLPVNVSGNEEGLIRVAVHGDVVETWQETLYLVMHEDVFRIGSVRAVAGFLADVLSDDAMVAS